MYVYHDYIIHIKYTCMIYPFQKNHPLIHRNNTWRRPSTSSSAPTPAMRKSWASQTPSANPAPADASCWSYPTAFRQVQLGNLRKNFHHLENTHLRLKNTENKKQILCILFVPLHDCLFRIPVNWSKSYTFCGGAKDFCLEFLGWLVAGVLGQWSIKYVWWDEPTLLPRTSCVSGGVELAHLGGGVGGNGGFSCLPGWWRDSSRRWRSLDLF